MPSSTKNVKLGVCQVFFDGVDLGYTQGGVEVTVSTETHKVNVDQFGKTTINEYILGRDVMAKVPMAETTLENMVAIMPGAALTQTGGTVASGTITFATAASVANDTVTVNGAVFTCKTVPATPYEFAPGASFTASAQNLAAVLQASTDPKVAVASYTLAGAVVTVKYGSELQYGTTGKQGIEGNAFTLAKSGTNVTVSGATLSGGVEPTSVSVAVATAIGTDLLAVAKELRFHPTSKAATDKSDDFVIPLAATSGALNFAYKLENERIYNVDFMGYPDANGRLFTVGA
jgi:hypothetical protein